MSNALELYAKYFESHGVESMSAIDFFKFEKFKYKHRKIASQEWLNVVVPAIEKINRKRARILRHEWEAKPQIRIEYWENKCKEEEKESHISAVRTEGRIQSIASVRSITNETVQELSSTSTDNSGLLYSRSSSPCQNQLRRMETFDTEPKEFPVSAEPPGNIQDQTLSDEGDKVELPKELAAVASCTPFAHLVAVLYKKYGHTPPRFDTPVSFPTNIAEELYHFAKGILDSWDTRSKIEQKNCLVALSGIINTLDSELQQNFTCFSDMANQCLNQELFTVSKSQEAIFQGLKLELGHGAIEDLRAMRRYCKRRYCDLEEERDHGAWPASEKDARNEELKIVLIMELLANEIIAMQNVPKASEHEDVFIWRGLARILYDYDLVVRVGELGSSATREDRAAMEQEFGGTDSNVRSKKIDLMHQLCLQGVGKPIELIAWEVKSSSVSPDILQIQLRKNIRTNASIMNNISQYMERTFPRPSPIILDIVGSKALAYTVRKFEPGAFGAGAVGDTMIQIPRHADEIPEFLDGGGLSALLRIGQHNRDFANAIKNNYRKAQRQAVMAAITRKANIRKEGPPVVFTPTKKQKQKQDVVGGSESALKTPE